MTQVRVSTPTLGNWKLPVISTPEHPMPYSHLLGHTHVQGTNSDKQAIHTHKIKIIVIEFTSKTSCNFREMFCLLLCLAYQLMNKSHFKIRRKIEVELVKWLRGQRWWSTNLTSYNLQDLHQGEERTFSWKLFSNFHMCIGSLSHTHTCMNTHTQIYVKYIKWVNKKVREP